MIQQIKNRKTRKSCPKQASIQEKVVQLRTTYWGDMLSIIFMKRHASQGFQHANRHYPACDCLRHIQTPASSSDNPLKKCWSSRSTRHANNIAIVISMAGPRLSSNKNYLELNRLFDNIS